MKSKKKVIVIVSIIVSILALAGAGVFLWFKTGVFNFLKPKEEVFSNQVEQALNLDGVKFSNYSEVLENYKDLLTKSSKSKMNISANLNISEIDEDVQDIINNSKITLETYSDPEKQNTQNKIGLYTKDEEVLTLDLVSNGTKMGIGCEDLYDKYLAISTEDLVEYYKKTSTDIDIDYETLEALTSGLKDFDPYKLLYISEDDLKHFDETYRNCLTEIIPEKCFTSEKGVEVDVDGDDVKTTAYYCTITGSDAAEAIKAFGKKVADDDTLTRIATEKINYILETANSDKIEEKDMQEMINSLVEELNVLADEIDGQDDSKVQVAVYSKNNKPVRLDFNVIEDDSKETLLSIEYTDEKTIFTLYSGEQEAVKVIIEKEKSSKEELIGKITAEVQGTKLGTVDYEIINKKSESKLKLDVNVPLAGVSAKIDFSSKGNIKKEATTFEGTVSIKYADQSAELKFDGSTEYTDVSIPELNSSNSINVLQLDDKEMEELATDILEKAADVLPDRLKLIGVDIDKEDILPTSSTLTTEVIEKESVEDDDTEKDTEKDLEKDTETETETDTDTETETDTDTETDTEKKDEEDSVDSSKTDINNLLNNL